MLDTRHDARISGFIGSSGSGKSTSIKRALQASKPDKLLIFDPLGEYAREGVAEGVASMRDVAAALADGRRKRVRVALQPSADQEIAKAQFDALCALAYAAGGVTLVAEELAFVTSPSWASPNWRRCTLQGRHKGLVVMGASQRPASIDKDFFGNCTVIRCGRLNYQNDIRVMSNVLKVQAGEVERLKPLEYIERNMQTGELSRGVLTF